jgi:hypothetical protein
VVFPVDVFAAKSTTTPNEFSSFTSEKSKPTTKNKSSKRIQALKKPIETTVK